ncbi:MAG TPA: APC family permease [Gemmatimonadaceae bacterium]|nr:APC family permease [Gemmatimonadaceae bacterium]
MAAPALSPALIRSIGRWSFAALVVNTIIGTGVFILPGTVAARLGWTSLTAWILAALATAAMILCFAEVASRFNVAGGAYLFTQAAFGRYIGLQIGWLAYVSRATAAAVQANLFTSYFAEFVPWASTRLGGLVITTIFIGFLAAVNLRSVLSGAQLSNVFAIVKTASLVAFGALGVYWLLAGRAGAGPVGSDLSAASWMHVLLLLMFAFGGFESALMPLAEVKDPQRDGPFALLVGLGLVTVVYLAAQITVLATLSDPGATNRPLAASARVMLGSAGAAAISIAALISVYGWLSSNMLAVPRLTMAMAQRNDLPAVFGRVHPVWRTPWISILAFAGIAWVLANQAGLLQNLSLSAVVRLFVYGLVCAALPVLRNKERRGLIGPAHFRSPAGLTLAVLSVAFSIVLATRMSWRETLTLGTTVGLATLHWFAVRRAPSVEPATQS